MLTQERLKEVLKYDPETGVFTWKNPRPGCSVGPVGSLNSGGYLQITIDGKSYRNHRLAWLYVHGYLPENDIDHINRIKTSNMSLNLREVSRVCNSRNRGNRADNKTGVKGVGWYASYGKWRAHIEVNGKHIFLGNHDCFTEAVCHRLAAEQAENWSGCDSSSPAYQYVKGHIAIK